MFVWLPHRPPLILLFISAGHSDHICDSLHLLGCPSLSIQLYGAWVCIQYYIILSGLMERDFDYVDIVVRFCRIRPFAE